MLNNCFNNADLNTNYEKVLDYIFNTLSNFSTTGKIKKYDLSNIKAFCSHLNNPHLAYKVIHIAGTNGKGSVASMLSAILTKANYNTGLYTSPHLYDFRERIRINGKQITKEYVVAFVKDNIQKIHELSLSFFEVTVAMAFKYFAAQNVEIAVIETGLGGILDSTNIVKPIISIITNISHDHKNYLGNNLKEIAEAKAGIIKNNVPVVVGTYNKRYAEVFINSSNEKKSPIYFADNYYKLKFIDFNTLKVLKPIESTYNEIFTDLHGIYQEDNIATVLKSVDVLNENKLLNISKENVLEALKDVKNLSGLQARWQTVSKNPKVILDVAHNKAGIKKILEQLKKEKYTNIAFIMGMMKDKDTSNVLKLLPKNASYYFPKIAYKRALDEQKLHLQAKKTGLKSYPCKDLNEAVQLALKNTSKDDLILICGSFFLIKDVINLNF